MLGWALVLIAGVQGPAKPHGVTGGQPAPDTRFDAVVTVEQLTTSDYCSGTLVLPDLVLTAAHCLEGIERPEALRVDFQSSAGASVGVVDFGLHPEYCKACDFDRRDFGFVRLEAPVEIPPATILTEQEVWDSTMRRGEYVTVVGYGDVPERDFGGIQRWRVEVPIRGFTGEGIEFVAGGDGKDSCGGDSGGPAFVTAPDGSLRLVGVTSRGSEVCGDGGFYGVAYHALEWLSEHADEPALCGSECGTCDCLDTTPLPEDGCCSTGRPQQPPWLLLAIVALTCRRRKSLFGVLSS